MTSCPRWSGTAWRARSSPLEITKVTTVPGDALAHQELTRLAAVGVHVVVDDYGVGWSNLSRVWSCRSTD